jgi:hypothetical protein
VGWRAKAWVGKDVREVLGFLGMTGRTLGPLGPPADSVFSGAEGRMYLIAHTTT